MHAPRKYRHGNIRHRQRAVALPETRIAGLRAAIGVSRRRGATLLPARCILRAYLGEYIARQAFAAALRRARKSTKFRVRARRFRR